ncbi:MAG: 4-hydroxythreonine-4-phosphate dehydrogenase PdxA [Bacteroidetes bacterium]|nr:4-hydroxythreonine-4-phosphate dehydrogenase PdxA [Bacteroidota bacterium]
MNNIPEKEKKIKVGITHGDINGIGYEIIIKSFIDSRIFEIFTPVVFGVSKVASYHRKALNINDFSFNLIKKPEYANPKRPNIINCYDRDVKIELGKSTQTAGELSLLALESAIKSLKNNEIDVLVTAPINKKNIQSKDFNFRGHTEYLAQRFECDKFLMLMISENFRIGVVTGHIPLKDVASKLSQEIIIDKLRIMNDSLIKDFNIRKPKIAILGLNPHAGDDGLIGKEEQEIIIPAIKKVFDDDILVYGPYPADGFFGSNTYSQFDGILAMYHDQAMIPFKALSFGSGVNFTAGLPYVRTSPAHGTAYEIAGKNEASPESFRQAIFFAIDIYKNRQIYEELNKNPLKISTSEQNNSLT